MLTVTEALEHVQWADPLSLPAQLEHLTMHADRCDDLERDVWLRAVALVRNGVPDVPEQTL